MDLHWVCIEDGNECMGGCLCLSRKCAAAVMQFLYVIKHTYLEATLISTCTYFYGLFLLLLSQMKHGTAVNWFWSLQ